MTREHKFRVWDIKSKFMWVPHIHASGRLMSGNEIDGYYFADSPQSDLMQYTGLKDKHDVEIYELMEIDKKFVVMFKYGKYVLLSISTGDILCPLFDYMDTTRNVEITREYAPI